VWALDDRFDDDTLTARMWHSWGAGTGLQTYTTAGRLEFLIGPGATPDSQSGLWQRYAEPCVMTGDFDARVDYQLLEWPADDGVQVALVAMFSAPPTEQLWTAARGGSVGPGSFEEYTSTVGASFMTKRVVDLSGTLRLTRTNGRLSAYYLGRRGWVKLASATERRFATLVLLVASDATEFGGHPARVGFDNFHATAADSFCPGPYYPARKHVVP